MTATRITAPEASAVSYQGFHKLWLYNLSYASHYIRIKALAGIRICFCAFIFGAFWLPICSIVSATCKLQPAVPCFLLSGFLLFIWSFNRALTSLVALFNKSNNINSGPPNNDKTQSSHTSNLKLYFLISGLSGEKYGNAIHTETGNNQKARYKVRRKLVWTPSSVVFLHIFFEHCWGVEFEWLLQVSKVTAKFSKQVVLLNSLHVNSDQGEHPNLDLEHQLIHEFNDKKDEWQMPIMTKTVQVCTEQRNIKILQVNQFWLIVVESQPDIYYMGLATNNHLNWLLCCFFSLSINWYKKQKKTLLFCCSLPSQR